MTKVYIFNNETIYEDLIDNNIDEENIAETTQNIIQELRMGKMVEIDGNYIIGNLSACLLYEKYKVNSFEELLI